jgi:hypothetical protein
MRQGHRSTDILGEKELFNGEDVGVIAVHARLQGGIDGLEFVGEGERGPGRNHPPTDGHRLSPLFGHEAVSGVLRAWINTDDHRR